MSSSGSRTQDRTDEQPKKNWYFALVGAPPVVKINGKIRQTKNLSRVGCLVVPSFQRPSTIGQTKSLSSPNRQTRWSRTMYRLSISLSTSVRTRLYQVCCVRARLIRQGRQKAWASCGSRGATVSYMQYNVCELVLCYSCFEKLERTLSHNFHCSQQTLRCLQPDPLLLPASNLECHSYY